MIETTTDRGLLARLHHEGYTFFTGVPDRGLHHLLDDLTGLPGGAHVPATWEGEAVALAAGAALGGQQVAVYLAEGGVGYAIEPLTTLCRAWGVEPLLLLATSRDHAEPRAALLDAIGWTRYRFVRGESA